MSPPAGLSTKDKGDKDTQSHRRLSATAVRQQSALTNNDNTAFLTRTVLNVTLQIRGFIQ